MLVVGAGPVGLAAAIEARLAGFETVVIDAGRDVIDKACGEGLMPGAVSALDRLGVHPAGADLGGIAYLRDGRSVSHRFNHGPGRGVRRTTLQTALTERAAGLGVARVQGPVKGVRQSRDWVEAGGWRGRWLLACDGLGSRVRRSLGLDIPVGGPARYGLRQHFAVPPWTDLVEVHWSDDAEAYVTPVGLQTVGIAILGPRLPRSDPAGGPRGGPLLDGGLSDGPVRGDAQAVGTGPRSGSADPQAVHPWAEGHRGAAVMSDLLGRFPSLAGRVEGAAAVSSLRGAGPLRRRASRVLDGRVFLVGDAAGYVDALTGEGIRVGLAQARAAVDALRADRPGSYPDAWRAITRDYRWLTATLVGATRYPTVRRSLVPVAARLPAVFSAAVELLAGEA